MLLISWDRGQPALPLPPGHVQWFGGPLDDRPDDGWFATIATGRRAEAVAAESTSLPSTFPRDPADRIIVATARVLGATLLTADRRIAESGVVPTVS